MKKVQIAGIVFSMLCLVAAVGAIAWADVGPEKKSTLTVVDRVEVPGIVLEPGTYVIKQVDVQNNRNIVQVTDVDETKVYTTMIATPHESATDAKGSTFVYYKSPPGTPRVLRTWFAPNDKFGQDFLYPSERAAQLSKLVSEKVPEATEADLGASARNPGPAMGPETVPARSPAEVAPAPIADADRSGGSEPSGPEASPEMPQTASPYPMLAGLGFLALFAGTLLRFFRRTA